MEDASDIVQEFLDHQGEATISGDVDATLGWCDIPCTLESFQVRIVATDEAEVRAICATFIDNLKAKRMTHMFRRCLDATFNGNDTISATYETRYIRDGKLLAEEPYVGFVILRRDGDRWKISNMQFAVGSDSPVEVTLRDWVRDRADK